MLSNTGRLANTMLCLPALLDFDNLCFMNGAQVLAFLLCERVVHGPGDKPTLYGIFDKIQFSNTGEKAGIFFVFYKVRSVQSGRLELSVRSPESVEIVHLSDAWSGGDILVQSQWALTLDKFEQNGTYRFALLDGPAGPVAYTELNVERV